MTTAVSTSVCIVGSGPAGLLLSQLLDNAGIDAIVIDRQDRAHIEGRIRAGVLEQGTVDALTEAGVGDRLAREGLPHAGFELAFDGDRHRIDIEGLTGRRVTVYGQTEVTRDLFDRRMSRGAQFYFGVRDVAPDGLRTDRPTVCFSHNGARVEISCDYVAGCDGFHGACRRAIPPSDLRVYDRAYPFGWLGVLTERPPVAEELVYANGDRGFALCSMRSATRSRYYLQCDAADDPADWSDDRFWDELSRRIGPELSATLQTGPSFEKSVAPLRSFVSEPMRYGNLFLAGDAAHIVPPTGAKGLNLAVADVRILARALTERYARGRTDLTDAYSADALARVWKVERFSWQLSMLMHRFPEQSDFDGRMQRAEFDYIRTSEAASRSIAENYVGLPLDP